MLFRSPVLDADHQNLVALGSVPQSLPVLDAVRLDLGLVPILAVRAVVPQNLAVRPGPGPRLRVAVLVEFVRQPGSKDFPGFVVPTCPCSPNSLERYVNYDK